MAFKVLIPEVVADEGIAHLKELGYEVKFGRGTDKATILEDIHDCDAVIIRVAVIDREIIEKSPKLKVIAKHGAGYDSIDTKAAADHGIRVVFAPTANSMSVAEQAVALMLACAKRIPFLADQYKKGNYKAKDMYTKTELCGKTLGLIGLGRIGMNVARIAIHGFGMKVIAYDPFIPAGRDLGGVELVQERDELLKTADYISIHVPATPENVKSISQKEFKLMKPTAIIINTARGTIIDQEALIEAIRNDEIAGAGLDVMSSEPVKADNILLKAKNCIITPHISWASKECRQRIMDCSVANLRAHLDGKPINIVNN